MKPLLVALLIILASGPAVAQLKGVIAGNVPRDTVWYDQWLERKKVIDSDPSGLAFEYFIHGELGNDEAVLAGLRRGRISIAGPSLTGIAGLIPEAAVISLPYLFETKAEADAYFKCCAATVFQPLFEEKGLIFLGWSEAGWKGIYSKTPITLPDDGRNLKLRIPAAITSQIFVEQFGADPIFLGINDVVASLETGLIDGGTATVPFYWGTARSIAHYFTVTDDAYEAAPFLANKKWWDGATAAQKSAIIQAFARYDEEVQQIRSFDKNLLQSLRDGKEVSIIDLTPQQKQEWVSVGRATHAKALAKIGGQSQMIYDQIQSVLKKIRESENRE